MNNILFSTAYAADAGAAGGAFNSAALMQYAPIVLVFIVFYFLLIRPQQKRQRELREQQGNLRRGDRILTAGGILGTVQNTREDSQEVDVEIAPGVKVKVIRSTITNVLSREGKAANDS
ncbi:preprotein translocase subunit YajC [Bombella sp. TMW 2.2543]|uniref:Sec translocon accessory complex subunit YajC n=1 Tax=Bombella pluederhausensis TaxID=2967336 RepID=A0ABT3WE50_9PROT|nr:preprotein translocase subunit YajC [Bombella pluederhausensis]MCX5617375.1 preprotein translocase subunit YajC [Bombella pluederhausensis]